jgi:eukaryotic-like serine/threonine-protein kinase
MIRQWILPFPAEERPDLLVDLVSLHLTCGWEAGPKPMLEEYVRELGPEFAEFASRESLPIDLIEAEFCARHEFPAPGSPPQIDDYLARFPGRSDVQECIRSRSLDGGRYTLTRCLGAGGLGRVWKAYDGQLNRQVAIKLPRPGLSNAREVRHMFEREGRIAAGLEHPSIVPVHEIAEMEDGTPYCVMRLVSGKPLDAMIRDHHGKSCPRDRRERSVRGNELLRHFVAVCNAIAYAHDRGVIHRDLKPANIVVGAFGEAVVLDWGLAEERGSPAPGPDFEPATTAPSEDGALDRPEGTEAYMSPEQAIGRSDVRNDIFCLGGILYSILTGRAPYVPEQGEDDRALRERIRKGRFPSPRKLRAGIPSALEAVCMKAMSPDPASRYSSARELADEIARFLADEPVLAGRDPLAERALRWMRRRRTAVTAVAAAVLLALLGLGGMLAVQARANRNLREAKGLVWAYFDNSLDWARRLVDAAGADSFVSEQSPNLDSLRRLKRDLERSRDDDPRTRAQLAEVCSIIGAITALLGKSDEAERSYEEACRVAEALAALQPREPASPTALAHACLGFSKLLSETGRAQRAVTLMEKGAQLSTQLAAEYPDDPIREREANRAISDLAVLYRDSVQLAKAETCFHDAIERLRRTIDNRPDDVAAQGELARANNNLGSLLINLGRPREARGSLVEARDIGRELTSRNSVEVRFQQQLGRSYMNLGLVDNALGREGESVGDFQASIKVFDALVREHPRFPLFRYDLATAYGNLGELHLKMKLPDDARLAFEKVGETLKRLVDDFPADIKYRNDYACYFDSLAELTEAGGNLKQATDELESAIAIRAELVKQPGAPRLIRRQLAGSQLKLGRLNLKSGHKREGLESLRVARRLLTELARDSTADLGVQSLLGEALDAIGQTLLEIGQPDQKAEASAAIKAARAYHDEACNGDPKSAAYQEARQRHAAIESLLGQH